MPGDWPEEWMYAIGLPLMQPLLFAIAKHFGGGRSSNIGSR